MQPGDNIQRNQRLPKRVLPIFSLLALAGLIIFLLSFHIVTHNGGITLIAKDHLSFSETIVSLDEIIQQYNSRNIFERLAGQGINVYLVQKLKDKGLIVTPGSEDQGTPERPYESTQAEDLLRVESVSFKMMSYECAWKATITNLTNHALAFSIAATAVDSEGFQVGFYETGWTNTLNPQEKKQFTGSLLCKSQAVATVFLRTNKNPFQP